MATGDVQEWAPTVRAAAAGDAKAVRSVVDAVTPAIQYQAVQLLRHGRGTATGRGEVEEMVQEVLCLLFRDRARILTTWDPTRGASLRSFVGVVARRAIAHELKVKRRHGLRAQPTTATELDQYASSEPPLEAAAISRNFAERVFERLRQTLSLENMELVRDLVIEQKPIEQIVARTGLSKEALYKRRSRLRLEVLEAAQATRARSEQANALSFSLTSQGSYYEHS